MRAGGLGGQLLRRGIGWLAVVVFGVLIPLAWLLAGTVELSDAAGSVQGEISLGEAPEAQFTGLANGLHLFDFVARPTDPGGARGFVVALFAGNDAATPRVQWTVDRLDREQRFYFALPPIDQSRGKTIYLQVTALPGDGEPAVLKTTDAGPALVRNGEATGTGLDVRLFYRTTPLEWLGVTLARAGGRAPGGTVLLLFLAFAGAVGAGVALLARQLLGAGWALKLTAGLVVIGWAAGLFQAWASWSLWARLPTVQPDVVTTASAWQRAPAPFALALENSQLAPHWSAR